MKISLSKYFPKGTEYFYSFPVGEDSDFFSTGPMWKEELIAARSLVCAGPDVKVITFASAVRPPVWSLLQDLGTPLAGPENRIVLPEEITAHVKGKRRNKMVAQALTQVVTPGKLIMAQPFLNDEIRNLFQIDPAIGVWCNDKKNMPEYIPTEFLPQRYAIFSNGAELLTSTFNPPLPCVVKISSSASGDGVRICHTGVDFQRAKIKFCHLQGTIFIEKFINSNHNICVQFGVPSDERQSIEIIGCNHQLTTPQGEFLGGAVYLERNPPSFQNIVKVVSETILPAIRQRGWFGVGGIDVLIAADGKFYFIDSNFRMTATFIYVCDVRNGDIHQSVVSFTGAFAGSEADFRKIIFPVAERGAARQLIQLTNLSEIDGVYHFNAGMFFDSPSQIQERATALINLGIGSTVLERLLDKPVRDS